MTGKELALLALEARTQAYAPYSGFKVGAALLCNDGTVYTGCNIENASYTPTVCAERVALFKAISEGKRGFSAIAVVGGTNKAERATPCGVCRQALSEFCGEAMKVYLVTGEDAKYDETTLGALLPMAFGFGGN